MDELRDKYYTLNDFIEELQDITIRYKDKVDTNYLEQIDNTWCQASDEAEELESRVEEIEKAEDKELINEYYREVI